MSESGVTGISASWGALGGEWAVLVHGGAGDVAGTRVALHVEGCRKAAMAAAQVLRAGGSALDAVERAVLVLEDDPLFNAGLGACLNADGLVELDAAIMEGSRLRAGAVCALPPFAHPISIARSALDEGRHVMYAALGAAKFASDQGYVHAADGALVTESARERWALAREGEHTAAETRERGSGGSAGGGAGGEAPGGGGTVGAVARDVRGAVAAATSTGGRVNKRVGRVGDSPVLGAGTYADDDAGACSATGDGEAILRVCLAKTAIDMLRARNHPEESARSAVRSMGMRVGGRGGVVLVDRFGRIGLARNTQTMTWAAAGAQLSDAPAGA